MSARGDRVLRRRRPRPANPNAIDPTSFDDRVMASIGALPQPTPARAFATALRAGAWGDMIAGLAVAWHLATIRSWPVALPVRARSMALVLAVATVLATSSLVAAVAVQTVVPKRDDLFDPRASLPGAIVEPVIDRPMMDPPDPRPAGGAAPVLVDLTENDGEPADAGDGDDAAEDEGESGTGGDVVTDDGDDADEDRADGGARGGSANDAHDAGQAGDGGGDDADDTNEARSGSRDAHDGAASDRHEPDSASDRHSDDGGEHDAPDGEAGGN